MAPPIGLTGYVLPVTKKRLKELAEKGVYHVITGYSPIFFNSEKSIYYTYMDERFGEKTVEELWTYLKENNLARYRRVMWQDI